MKYLFHYIESVTIVYILRSLSLQTTYCSCLLPVHCVACWCLESQIQYSSNCIPRSHNTLIQYTKGGLCQCKHCRTLELSNLALSKVAHGGGGGEGKLMCTKYQIRKFSQWKLANTHNMIDKHWSQADLIITK